MRTEKELWGVVLSRPDLFKGGLCVWIRSCFDGRLISFNEFIFLDNTIWSLRTNSESYWIGPKGELQPRIDWINERIKQL